MGLFLANHSTERILLMGRWLSQAFLAYICPQIIEWTNNMSRDMIRHDSFTDASGLDMADPGISRGRHSVLLAVSTRMPYIQR